MSELFPNQDYYIPSSHHESLPLIETYEFDFYRGIEFCDAMYGKTVSQLHAGNLRVSRYENRYSNFFIGQKLSYWADSPETVNAEMNKWKQKKDRILFWAYDDASSTFPTVYPRQKLLIIDGRELGLHKILKKLECHESLKKSEIELIDLIASYEPDCLAYKSVVRAEGVNYLFFEHGFRKLSLREVSIRLGERNGNKNTIFCAGTCDYAPYLERYGDMFLPIARIGHDPEYKKTDEYLLRHQVYMQLSPFNEKRR